MQLKLKGILSPLYRQYKNVFKLNPPKDATIISNHETEKCIGNGGHFETSAFCTADTTLSVFQLRSEHLISQR